MTEELSRKELYNLVWCKPMSGLAQEMGISDRGLAKVCARNNIPVPPRGYWARKEAGQPVKQPPFHATPPGKPDRVFIEGNPLPDVLKAVLQEEKQRRREKPVSPATPLKIVDEPHQSIASTVDALRGAKPDKDGVISACQRGHCGISIGATSLERVISILDALARRVEERGMALTPLDNEMRISIDKDGIECSIVEKVERVKHIPSVEELAEEDRLEKKRARDGARGIWDFPAPRPYPEFDFIRTGNLSVEIKRQYTGADSLRRNWRDGRKTIEDQLDEAVSGMLAYLVAVKERRLRDEERDRKSKRDGQIRGLQRQYNERENKRLDFLATLMDTAHELDAVKSFMSRVNSAGPSVPYVQRMLLWTKE
jgi:hypothetical protein